MYREFLRGHLKSRDSKKHVQSKKSIIIMTFKGDGLHKKIQLLRVEPRMRYNCNIDVPLKKSQFKKVSNVCVVGGVKL